MLVKHGPQTQQAQASGVNLAEALSLLRQAGYPDPTLEGIGGARVLQSVIDGLCELSMHDGLTGLANARYFRMALEREVHRASRTGETCSLLMLDLDHLTEGGPSRSNSSRSQHNFCGAAMAVPSPCPTWARSRRTRLLSDRFAFGSC